MRRREGARYTHRVNDQIWLIGFSGSGKSRLARPLAAALNWAPLDLDKVIEQHAGDTIAGIFAAGGEGAFRVLETQAVEEAAQRSNVVVATGGGAVLAEANRRAMRHRGFIVCLEARPETLLSRLRASNAKVSDRPLLEGDNPLARIIELKAQRQPLYDDADLVIETDDLTPDEITHRILAAFRERSTVGAGGA